MAKLYFRHGTMDSAKTLNLLAVAHNYRSQGKRVLLVKPRTDDRFGAAAIRSRAGIEAEADMLVDDSTRLDPADFRGIDCVLVDEAQFLSPALVEQLRALTQGGPPVICYGLRTDFRTGLFPGSRRLLELADSIEEVKVTCQFCNRKAIFNLRMQASDALDLRAGRRPRRPPGRARRQRPLRPRLLRLLQRPHRPVPPPGRMNLAFGAGELSTGDPQATRRLPTRRPQAAHNFHHRPASADR
ncbi:thymidine kinase [Nannocystis sp.]|uniref:thymidine kinase n=1 Tax=Nannocystis sp. TaxID=1962667 RepID=UPI0025D9998C|nr:thymidine kinase [Nannocystis sp.]